MIFLGNAYLSRVSLWPLDIFWFKLAGSILEAMAKAVENAEVVIVCLTQKYKESPNCRTGRFSTSALATFLLRH